MEATRLQFYERMLYQYGLHSLLIAMELNEASEKYQEHSNFRKLSNYNKSKARFNAVLIIKNSE